jgi:hypothetical protein
MLVMPGIRVFSADPVQIRTRSTGPPQKRPVVSEFLRFGVFTVSQHFGSQRSYRLGVAVIAALSHIKVTTFEFDGGIGFDIITDRLCGRIEQRNEYGHDSSYKDDNSRQDSKNNRFGIDPHDCSSVLKVG